MLLIDEADALVEADAKRGYPLLSELRTLQAEGACSFVLTGYWHLYRRTLDHGSPLYNFAPVRRLGPLEPEAGSALATEPMARLGLTWADAALLAGEDLEHRVERLVHELPADPSTWAMPS